MDLKEFVKTITEQVVNKISEVETKINDKMENFIDNITDKIDQIQTSIKEIQTRQNDDKSEIIILKEQMKNLDKDFTGFCNSQRSKHDKIEDDMDKVKEKVGQVDKMTTVNKTNTGLILALLLAVVVNIVVGIIK